MTLTRMETSVLCGLTTWLSERGRMPSSKELVHYIGWRGRGPLTPVLRSLEAKGAIRYTPGLLPVVVL